MKGLKKLALASAVLAVSTGAFAMEALQDDALSSTTGQAGLTITTSGTDISATAIRYYDSNGTTGASTAYGLFTTVFLTNDGSSTGTPISDAGGGANGCGGAVTSVSACADLFNSGGSLNINGFHLTEGASTTTIDVGSTGAASTSVSGLLVGVSANNLTVTLGGISIDNGTEVAAGANKVSYTSGFLSSGKDLGGLALSNINLPKSVMLITAGAPLLNTLIGPLFNSGLTITSLSVITDLNLTAYYYNTELQSYNGAAFTANTAALPTATAGVDGVIKLPIDLKGVLTGPIEVGVGIAGGGYATSAGQGLQVLMTGTSIGLLDIGTEGLGGSGIQIAGTNVGSIGILGLKIGSQLMSISGH